MTKNKRILVGFALGLALVAGGVGYSKWQTAQDFRAYINSRQWVETVNYPPMLRAHTIHTPT